MINYLYLLQITRGFNTNLSDFGEFFKKDEIEDYSYNGEEFFDKNFEIIL